MGSYGYFDESAREYVITSPETPAPWINYLMGKNLKAFISQGAGGMLWQGEPNCGRLTRYRFNGLPADSPGFYLYIKDGESVWNPSYYPVMAELDSYECRHGLGYTRFAAGKDQLSVEVTYLIPIEDDIFLWDIRVKNLAGQPKDISIYPYMEFALHDCDKDTYHFLVCGNQARYSHDPELNALMVDYFAFEATFMGKSIFSSSLKFANFDLDRDRFIGRGRTEANPIGLVRGLSNSEVKDGGRYACGVFENVLHLEPGEEKRFFYKYAVSESFDESRKINAKYSSAASIDEALKSLGRFWDQALSTAQVDTPDPAVNALLNTWLPNNVRVTLKNARSISTRHSGSSAALCFRDTMQDAMPCTQLFADDARVVIEKALSTMLANGRTVRSVNPETMQAPETDFVRIDAAVWGVFTVYQYLAETGDLEFLNQVLPYYDAGEGSVLEHLLRGLRFIAGHTGKDGLPDLFDVDWNDMLQIFSAAKPGGQTVMVAQQFIYAARLLLEILDCGNEDGPVDELEQQIDAFTRALNSDAVWDGKWFRRLLFADGEVMGSQANAEAKIFLNTQSWAVIAASLSPSARFAPAALLSGLDPEKTRTAMNSVYERLNTEYGLRIFSPPFTRMSDGSPFNGNTPGAGENGGLFLHANTWAIIAEAILGNGDRAWEYFSKILPAKLSERNHKDPQRGYANEPYAFTSWIYGPDHERFGNGQLSWLTGGAAWIYKAGLEYILGIRPTLNGLRIDPCIPKEWEQYSVTRKLRGTTYHIEVGNPQHVSKGKIRLKVDGKDIEGQLIPYTAREEITVEVTI